MIVETYVERLGKSPNGLTDFLAFRKKRKRSGFVIYTYFKDSSFCSS